MRLRTLFLVAAAGIAVPLYAHAMSLTTWDFHGGNVPGKWEVTGLSEAAPSDAGLKLRADSAGKIMAESALDHDTEAVTLYILSPRDAQILLLWHRRNTPPQETVQLPVKIKGSPEEQKIELSLTKYHQWDRRPDVFGIGLPPKTDLTIGKIELMGWSVFENIIEGVKAFWTFDDLNPYSINFLWGPLLNGDPIARIQQFTMLPPPVGWSFNRVLLPVLAIAGIVLGFFAWGSSALRRKKMALIAVCIFGGAWLVWDLRMGLEFIHYAKQDATRYVFKPIGQRKLRTMMDFYDVAEFSKPYLMRWKRYAFLSPPSLPFETVMRYLTYPSLPVREGEGLKDVEAWLTFLMSDVMLNEYGQLTLDSLVLSRPGGIVKQFSDTSLLFVTKSGATVLLDNLIQQ